MSWSSCAVVTKGVRAGNVFLTVMETRKSKTKTLDDSLSGEDPVSASETGPCCRVLCGGQMLSCYKAEGMEGLNRANWALPQPLW